MDIPAGWYQDPSDQAVQRWWDGTAWTEHTLTAQQLQQVASPEPAQVEAEPAAEPVKRTPKQKAPKKQKPAKPQKTIRQAAKTEPTERRHHTFAWVVGIIVALMLAAGGAYTYITLADPFGPPQTSTHQSAAPTPSVDPATGIPNELMPIPDIGALDEAKKVAAQPDYADCAAVIKAGHAPIVAGQPGFKPEFDPDGNGIGCES